MTYLVKREIGHPTLKIGDTVTNPPWPDQNVKALLAIHAIEIVDPPEAKAEGKVAKKGKHS